ncbi:MAG TPA: hypothetical protein VFQ16_13705 [Burkholderiaceae bacterium]|nr:hypothetical protein [Burkholderiaceae bacterium]
MNRLLARTALTLATGLLLGACGGGSDGNVDPTTYNVAAAYQNLLTTTHHWALAGTDSLGFAWTMQLDGAPLPAGAFPMTGEAAGRLALTVSASAAGTSDTGTMTYYFNGTSAARELIGIEMPDGTCARASTFTVPPAVASIGSSGPLAAMTAYASCTAGAPAAGGIDYRWSIVRDGSVVLFCMSSEDGSGSSEVDCLEVATDGALGARARVTLTMPGYQLIAKNY